MWGSSPPARGAPRYAGADQLRTGIIPARAGSTTVIASMPTDSQDHPRLRGEHIVAGLPPLPISGSSPPARGARLPHLDTPGVVGIIPACAGSTPGQPTCLRFRGDHPRLRGEHIRTVCQPSARFGSSPPARGARQTRCRECCRPRIIPACAGSTPIVQTGVPHGSDHPRLRGEHAFLPGTVMRIRGSSPPARGARTSQRVSATLCRIIPACAGSTSYGYAVTGEKPDHPRLRGEH